MLQQASPLYHAKQSKAVVPFLLVHGTKDSAVPIEDSR